MTFTQTATGTAGLCIYLDDERRTPEGWLRVYWPDEAIALLQQGGVSEISLDHDLGDDERGTGYDVIAWIEEAAARLPPAGDPCAFGQPGRARAHASRHCRDTPAGRQSGLAGDPTQRPRGNRRRALHPLRKEPGYSLAAAGLSCAASGWPAISSSSMSKISSAFGSSSPGLPLSP